MKLSTSYLILPLLLLLTICSSVSLKAQKPTPNFSAEPLVGCAPLTVYFTDKSSNDALDWEWDFDNNGIYDVTGDPIPVHVFTVPGYYSVRLTVSNFFDSATTTKTRYIRVTAPPAVSISNLTICPNDSVRVKPTILGGIRPFTYFWSALDFPFSSTDSIPTFGPDTTRQWSLELSDSAGCVVETQFVITVRPGPAKPVLLHNWNALSTTSTATGYQWYYNGSAISGATAKTYTVDTSKVKEGFYQVEVRDAVGCKTKSDSVLVTQLTDVARETDEARWLVYPNPASTVLHIRSSELAPDAVITLFSPVGEELRTARFEARSAEFILPVSSLAPGVYVVQVRDQHATRAFKVVRE